MKPEPDITRRCKECADWTHTVCCFAFDQFWRVKSSDGRGCAHPLDAVAESWRHAGWTPGEAPRVQLALPIKEKPKLRARPTTLHQFSLFSSTPILSDDDY